MEHPVLQREELAHYGPVQRAKDIIAVALFLGLSGAIATKLVRFLEAEFDDVALLSLAILVGYVVADFVSGFVHWMGDTWGNTQMPVLGPGFIRPFREHHVDPKAITRHDFFETNGNNCLVSMPVLAGLAWAPVGGAWYQFIAWSSLSLVLWVFLTNQFHKWAHMDSPPALIAFLQKRRLILEPNHHNIHHTAPYDKYYCITSGVLNELLDRVDFFKRTERLVTRVSGVLPRVEDNKSYIVSKS